MKITGIDQLLAAAKFVRDIPAASQRAGYRAVNNVLGRVETQARRDIAAQINLPQSYIREQTRTTKAGPDKPAAYIRMRIRAIRMARFDARQITTPAQRAKGDPRRSIAKGRKAAGVSVKIGRKGGRTSRQRGFLIPLRNAGVQGLFVRTGPGPRDIEHKYGPSPDQLFRRWRTTAAPDIARMLFQAYSRQLRYELRPK